MDTGCPSSAVGFATCLTSAWKRSWAYVSRLAQRSEEIGFDLTLIAELFLNDIKGIDAPALDAWSTAAALAAVTKRLELMVAVRPTFHQPAILAKHAANIDQISNGRLALNVVSSWWADEARRYGVQFDQHDDRYARTAEWLDVIDGAWKQPKFDYSGKYYQVNELVVEPKPVRRPRPTIYAGGESEAAKSLISRSCDAYVMHGDPPERVAPKVADMAARREKLGLVPMTYGMAGYVIVRDSETEAKRELERITNVSEGSPGLRELPGLDLTHEARAAGEPAGLLGLEPRAARWTHRNRRAGCRADHRARERWRVAATTAVQSTARGDGTVCRDSHAACDRGKARRHCLTTHIGNWSLVSAIG